MPSIVTMLLRLPTGMLPVASAGKKPYLVAAGLTWLFLGRTEGKIELSLKNLTAEV